MVYMVNFHLGRRVFNRYFSSREKALQFAASLWQEPGVDDAKGIFLIWEPMDLELEFHRPKGGTDPEPEAAMLQVCRDGVTEHKLR